MDDVTWWTAFGAIAQALGAVATFAAVAVALWQVSSDRRLSVRLWAGIRLTFAGDGSPPDYFVGFHILNTGLRPIRITGIGWRTGWLRRGPKMVTHRYAVQMTNGASGPSLPFELQPSVATTILLPVEHFEANHGSSASVDMFQRRTALLGNAPVHAFVDVSGRGPVFVKAESSVVELLRTGRHKRLDD